MDGDQAQEHLGRNRAIRQALQSPYLYGKIAHFAHTGNHRNPLN